MRLSSTASFLPGRRTHRFRLLPGFVGREKVLCRGCLSRHCSHDEHSRPQLLPVVLGGGRLHWRLQHVLKIVAGSQVHCHPPGKQQWNPASGRSG